MYGVPGNSGKKTEVFQIVSRSCSLDCRQRCQHYGSWPERAVNPFVVDNALRGNKGIDLVRGLANKAMQCEYLRVTERSDGIDIQQIGRGVAYSMRTPTLSNPNMQVLTSAAGAMVFAALIAASEVVDGFRIWTRDRGVVAPSSFNANCLAVWDGITSVTDIWQGMVQMGVRSAISTGISPVNPTHNL